MAHKREKRLTKRERQEQAGGPRPQASSNQHIHCIACGRHMEPTEFTPQGTGVVLTCKHGSQFPSCRGCASLSQGLLDEHDRTGQGVKAAEAWH